MIRQPTSRTSRGTESGQAAVEFALVLPLLLVIVLGLLDFGFAFNYWTQETNLASTAARYAVVNRSPDPNQTLQDYIRSQASRDLRNGGTRQTPNPLQVCVTYPAGKAIGNPVHVEVKTTYQWMPYLGLASTTIGGSATMRLEQIPDPAIIPDGCA